MTIKAWLHEAGQRLRGAGIESYRLDCLLLLEDALGKDRAWLLAHDDTVLTAAQRAELDGLVTRRAEHEPLAYLRGFVEFYGRRFAVTPDVLVTRPESEALIELAKAAAADRGPLSLVDVGTGSGCLGLTLAVELPDSDVLLVDDDPAALQVAAYNADDTPAAVALRQADLLEGLDTLPFDIVIANLPYVPAEMPVNRAATHEPSHALFAGADGLDCYRRLFAQLDAREQKVRSVITEALPDQHDGLAVLAKSNGYDLYATTGFGQRFERP